MRTKRPLLFIVDLFRNEQGQSDRTKETDRLSFDTSIGHVFPFFYSSLVSYSPVLWRLMSLVYKHDIYYRRQRAKQHAVKGSMETSNNKSTEHRQHWDNKRETTTRRQKQIFTEMYSSAKNKMSTCKSIVFAVSENITVDDSSQYERSALNASRLR